MDGCYRTTKVSGRGSVGTHVAAPGATPDPSPLVSDLVGGVSRHHPQHELLTGNTDTVFTSSCSCLTVPPLLLIIGTFSQELSCSLCLPPYLNYY
ncbi:hypothetical protein JZ751_010997 [Albula glossodonta]|uniref:Uncharacterized protein n=1 Tax=Albula glossodonta TaxID=121402 RepID=A0A8T2P420_9TELE|nr:hypothetical protein JZ751_010997 [Albula glossodonta]